MEKVMNWFKYRNSAKVLSDLSHTVTIMKSEGYSSCKFTGDLEGLKLLEGSLNNLGYKVKVFSNHAIINWEESNGDIR